MLHHDRHERAPSKARRWAPPLAVAALGGAPLLWAVACQDTSYDPSKGAGGGGVGGAGSTTYEPAGCGFDIRPRAEYKEWEVGSTVVGASPAIRRVRVGLGGRVTPGAVGRTDPSTSFGVAWETEDDTKVSEIQWGETPDPSTWPAENRRNGVTWLTPEGTINAGGDQRMHEVYVCGLEPSTTYYYRVGGGPEGAEVWSDVLSYATLPAAGDDVEVVVGLSGDSRGQQDDAWRLIQRRMKLLQPTFQMFSGDMINFAPDQGEWEAWLNAAERDTDGSYLTLGSSLVVPAHGNHDNHTSLFYGNLVQPQEEGAYPGYGELLYSFDAGPVHVIVVDDVFVAFPSGDQSYKGVAEAWLRADLEVASQNRADVPWIVAMHHHPEYSSSLHGEDQDVQRVRDFLAPIWHEYEVDLVVAGHDHNYERSKRLSGASEAPTIQDPATGVGTTYLVCAGAGADPYGSGTTATTDVSRSYATGGAIGFYGILRVSRAALTIEAHELRADATDPIFDTITLTK